MNLLNNNKNINFVIKVILIALPAIALITTYLKDDPYKVVYKYSRFSDFYKQDTPQIPINRDYAVTEIFLKNYSSYNYDSYIFGSSRSLAFQTNEWKKYVNGICYHFDASGENLLGINGKFELLKNLNAPIRNCLIICDPHLLGGIQNYETHLLIKHPLISDESNTSFQYLCISTFFNNKFFIPYLMKRLNLKIPSFLDYPAFFDKRGFIYDTCSNDMYFSSVEKQIKEDRDGFYKQYEKMFCIYDTTNKIIAEQVIDVVQTEYLNNILDVLKKNKTNYKIIIYPNYNQNYLNPEDLKILKGIFGDNSVYDYSGVNKFTINKFNYYDSTHCKPNVAEEILKDIYR
jgi:hypothetical protein